MTAQSVQTAIERVVKEFSPRWVIRIQYTARWENQRLELWFRMLIPDDVTIDNEFTGVSNQIRNKLIEYATDSEIDEHLRFMGVEFGCHTNYRKQSEQARLEARGIDVGW